MTFPETLWVIHGRDETETAVKPLSCCQMKVTGLSLTSQGDEAILVSQRILTLLGDRMEPWDSTFLVALLLLRWASLLPKVPGRPLLCTLPLLLSFKDKAGMKPTLSALGLIRLPPFPTLPGHLHIQKLF